MAGDLSGVVLRSRALQILAVVAIIVLLTPSFGQAKPTATGSIKGYVYDAETLDPLYLMRVGLTGPVNTARVTDGDGYFEFLKIPLGTYEVSVSDYDDNYYELNDQVRLISTKAISKEYYLVPHHFGNVQGQLKDVDTQLPVLKGAEVTLANAEHTFTATSTNPLGVFDFASRVDIGTYTMTIERVDYYTYVHPSPVVVTEDQTTSLGYIYMTQIPGMISNSLIGGTAIARIGDTAYIFGALDLAEDRQIIKYNLTTGIDKTLQNTLPAAINYAACAWTGEYVYLFGGGANQVIKYNPVNDGTVVYSNCLPASPYRPTAIWTGTYIYLLGGFEYSIVRFDPVTNTATTMPTTLPWYPGPHARSVYDGEYAYLVGFTSPSTSYDGVLRYHPETDTVTAFQDVLPATCLDPGFLTWDGRYVHIFGESVNGSGYTDEVWRFDPISRDTVVLDKPVDTQSNRLCGVSDGFLTYMFDDDGRVNRYCDHSAVDDRGVDSNNIYVGGLVDTSSGNLIIVEDDKSVQGRFSTISFIRTYNSLNEDVCGQMGNGWRHNYEVTVDETSSGSVMLTQSCGSRHLFVRTYDGEYITPPGLFDRLTRNSSTGMFTLWSLDGSRQEFDSLGRLSKMADRNSNMITLTYASSGVLSNVSDGSGAYLRISEGNNRVTGVYDPSGDAVTYYYSYTQENRITWVNHREPDAFSTPIARYDYYTLPGPMASMQFYVEDRWIPDFPYAPAMIMDCTNFSYDPGGRVAQIWRSEAAYVFYPDAIWAPIKKYSMEYISQSVVRSTCALGGTLTVEMNSDRLPVHVYGSPMTGEPGNCGGSCGGSALFPGEPGNEELTLTWTDSWQIASSTDGNGHTYYYNYDEYGNLVSVTDPMGNSTSYEYEVVDEDARYISLLESSEDELGYDTLYEYDSRGNTVKVTDPLGNYVQHSYDIYGNVLQMTNKRGYTTTNVYDSRGYLISTTNALGYTTYYNYSITGELEDVTSALGYSTSAIYNETYDAPETITYADGGTVKIGRFPTGDISAYLDQSGNITGYDINVTLRVNDAVTDALGYTTRYYYNSMGFLIRAQDANGHSYSFTYDTYARLKTVTYPLGQVYELWYDHAGNVVTRRDASGNETDYVYDALNRLVEAIYPDGQRMKWTYNAASQTTNVSGNGFWESTKYDELGRVVEVTTGYQFLDSTNTERVYRTVETITYDPNSNALTDAFVAGSYSTVTTYSYDAIDRLTRVDSQSGLYWKFYYDADNRRTNLVAGPGGLGSYPYNISYTYDEIGHVLSITTVTSPGIYKPPNSVYEYDAMGRMTSSLTGGLFNEYAYDAVGQLISSYYPIMSGNEPYWINFTYDGVGNRLSMVKKGAVTGSNTVTTDYTYDSNDRLTSSTDGYTYGYDANGNTVTASKVGDTRRMSYDYENRLVSVLDDGVEIARYEYSSDGKLMVRSWMYGSGGVFLPDVYVYTHVTGLPTVALRYSEAYGWDYDVFYYSLNTDEALGMKYGYDDLEYFYFLDAMGNTRSVLKAKTNTPTTTSQTYTPFGVMLSPPTSELSFWARIPSFQGRIYDVASGAYNFRARDYNPSTGRFLQGDPQPSYGASPYGFAGNDPLMNRDPTGMKITKKCGEKLLFIFLSTWFFFMGISFVAVAEKTDKWAHLADALNFAICQSGVCAAKKGLSAIACWGGILLKVFTKVAEFYKDNFVKGWFKKVSFVAKWLSRLAAWQIVLVSTLAYLGWNLALWYAGGCRF